MRHTAFITLGCILLSLASRAELPGTGPIAVPESGPLEKDHQALRMRWAQKHLLPAAEPQWRGQAWAEQARDVTLKGLQLWFGGPFESASGEAKTVEAAKALLRTECSEPLACLMAHKILWQLGQDWWGGNRGLGRAFKVIDDTALPGALRVWIVDEQIDRLKSLNWRYDNFHREQAERIAQAVSDAGYGPGFEPVLVRDFLDWMENIRELDEQVFQKLEKVIADCPHDEWTRACLLGDLHVHWAWFIRGGSWARDVKDEAWKGFAEHLATAASHLGKAHKLHPERPEAAARMIQVVMGTNGGTEKLRAWFDRAVAAQFDYRNAYSGLVHACTERWGGSDELVLTLGRRFAETRRHDTHVPEEFFQACKQIAMEHGNARKVFSNPLVKETSSAFARGLLDHQETNPARARRSQGLAAVTAWLAGDDALASRALKSAGRNLVTSVARDLGDLLHHQGTLRTSVFAGNGGWGEGVQRLEHQYRQHDVAAALQTLAGLTPESLPTDNARSYVAEIRAVLELPERLKDGGWHPLPVFQGLSTCLCSGGNWRVTASGELSLTGRDAAFLDLAFPILVDEAFEIRGEVSYDLIPESQWFAHWSFGPSLRWLPARQGAFQPPHAVRGLTYHSRKGSVEARVTGVWNNKFQDGREVSLKPVNTFLAGLRGDQMGFTFNEAAVPPQDIKPFGLRHSKGLVAFTGMNVPTGVKIRLNKLEVRLAR